MGKLEGRIIDVVERATSRFVGTYFVESGMGWVQIDGKVFTNPVYVGDPGAKGAQVGRQGGGRHGPLPFARPRWRRE